jgi:hypothetical protein
MGATSARNLIVKQRLLPFKAKNVSFASIKLKITDLIGHSSPFSAKADTAWSTDSVAVLQARSNSIILWPHFRASSSNPLPGGRVTSQPENN